jgi:hypothetical protein
VGQKPFSSSKPAHELICRNCRCWGHVEAYCPDGTMEQRQEAEERFQRHIAAVRRAKDKDKAKSADKDKDGKPPGNKSPSGKYEEDTSALPVGGPGPMAHLPDTSDYAKNLNIAAVVEGSSEIVLGLDTHADVSFIQQSLVPEGTTIRPAAVAVRGIGSSKAIGWAEVTLLLKPATPRPMELWTRLPEVMLVMPDKALPRDALLSFTTMMKRGVVLNAKQADRIELMDEVFPLVKERASSNAAPAAGAADVAVETLALPASVVLGPILECAAAAH